MSPRRPYIPQPVYLSASLEDWFWLECPSCRHALAVLIEHVLVFLGPSATYECVRRRARCMHCGHKGGVISTPSWGGSHVGISPYPFPTDHEIDRMCNLYSMTRAPEAIRRLFKISHNRSFDFEPKSAIFPGHTAPVIRSAADGDRELVPMSWGFVLPQPGKAPRRVTNTRDDKVLTSRFWNSSFRERRCLIPASAFCEPHGSRTPATWHWFAAVGEEPRPLFAFAGIWQHHKGPLKKDGPPVELDVYSFMTSDPNALTATINHERSPVLLTKPDEWQTWLAGSPEDAFKLIRPIAPERLRIVQEGFEKKDLLEA